MTDRYLIPLPGVGTLVLDAETYAKSLTTAAASPDAASATEPLVDAETLAKLLSLPQSWLEQRTREDQLPCYRAGRWIRYKRSEVEATLRTQGKLK